LPKYSSVQLHDILLGYYKLNSKDSLRTFLSNWNKMVPSSSDRFMHQNDTVENIFKVFYELYKPFKFGSQDADNYFSNEIEYILIQNEIEYDVYSTKDYKAFIKYTSDRFPNNTVRDYFYNRKKLLNFRPMLSFTNIKFLYLTAEYKNAIVDFLGTEQHNIGEGDIMNTAYPKGETYNRYSFLCPILPIVYGHWGGYWNIETFPIIYSIVFDDKFQHALVDFRVDVGRTVRNYKLINVKGHWKTDKNEIIRFDQE
jgi:hypothetical protein